MALQEGTARAEEEEGEEEEEDYQQQQQQQDTERKSEQDVQCGRKDQVDTWTEEMAVNGQKQRGKQEQEQEQEKARRETLTRMIKDGYRLYQQIYFNDGLDQS